MAENKLEALEAAHDKARKVIPKSYNAQLAETYNPTSLTWATGINPYTTSYTSASSILSQTTNG